MYVTKADYIYIDHPPPLLRRPFVRKMKKHCRQSYLTISDSNDNENNRKFEPTLRKSPATTVYIFFLQFSLSPTVGGDNTESLIFVLYFHGALWRLLLLLLCTKLTRRMEDQADVKYLVLNHICSIYFSKCFQWFYINSFCLHLIEKVSFCLQGIFSKLFRRLRESNTGHG